jgi:antitoxin component HigA of HigAB toxin-antitoxin module
VEGFKMKATKKLMFQIKYDVLEERHVESPGEAFDRLCSIFPIQPIVTKSSYHLALEIVTKITEALSDFSLEEKSEKEQVLKYIDVLSTLIEAYESIKYPKIGKNVTDAQVLNYLMQEHNLKQIDLKKELGGQSVVSDILSGKRKLNVNQIEALAKRFKVSPSLFF